MVQQTADISKELKETVATLQRELVMSGEMQSRQREIMTHVNAIRFDATNAMLNQESYKHNLNGMFDRLIVLIIIHVKFQFWVLLKIEMLFL